MTMGIAEQWAHLESRLLRLENLEAIRDALHRYAHSIDYGLEADWVDCFTINGRFVFKFQPGKSPYPGPEPEGGAAFAFAGHAELAHFIRGHSRAPDVYHKHLMVEPRIELRGDTARVSSYFVLVLEMEDRSRDVFTFGRYLDVMELGGDGRWRFRERIAEVEACGTGTRLNRAGGSAGGLESGKQSS
jgi:3-phenylpropionate/cinnamic acid dioxygenase small subunit